MGTFCIFSPYLTLYFLTAYFVAIFPVYLKVFHNPYLKNDILKLFLCQRLIVLAYISLGPVCEDPGRPPDGMQMASSYEHGSEVLFGCERPGYIPYTTDPITCVKSKFSVLP